MEFVKIPAGSFLMGSPENEKERFPDEQQHEVTILPFTIQATPVTRKQYHDVLGENPSHFKNDWHAPVDRVSWHDAQRFIAALNKKESTDVYRLPSEAEWEYACRAGSTGSAYFGEDSVGKYAWYYENSNKKTHPVGQKLPNAFSLYDMLGNVWEWCEDIYAANYKPTDSDTRVLRGGSWDYRHAFLRSTIRGWGAPVNRNFSTGLRLARTI